MSILWSLEKLNSLCRHKDNDVRRWAAEKLIRQYPQEATETLVRLVGDVHQPIAAQAAKYFYDRLDARYADKFLSALKTSSGRVAGRLSRALGALGDERLLEVVREKYSHEPIEDAMGFALVLPGVALLRTEQSQIYVEGTLLRLLQLPFVESLSGSFFAANLMAGTDTTRLLRFCIQNRASETLPSLLFEILSLSGSWALKEDLNGNQEKRRNRKDLPIVVQDSIESIDEMGWAGPSEVLKDLFVKGKFDQLIGESNRLSQTILEERRYIAGEEGMHRWQENRETPLLCADLLAALQAVVREIPKGVKETAARSALAALAQLAELTSLIGADPKTLDREAALHLFVEDRSDAPQDRQIMDVLAADEQRDEIIGFLMDHLKKHAYMESAPRIAGFLGRFMTVAMAQELLRIDFAGEDLDNAICAAVSRLGQPAIPLLRPIFENNDEDRLPVALNILEDLPYEEAGDLILSHWPALREKHREWLIDVMRSLGDKRFIGLLRKELREGEPEEESFRLLCLINGISDPRLKRIEQELNERRLREEALADALESGDYGALLYEPIDVSLACRSCKGVFHYRVKKIHVTTDSNEIIIADTIVCKGCGVVDHYETEDNLTFAVSARLAMLGALPSDDQPDIDMMTVVPVKTSSALGDGLSMKEMFARYEKMLAGEPDNPEILLGYANLLRQAKRTEDAVPFYKKVLEKDPLAVEALACLGDYAYFKGDKEKAFDCFSEVVELQDRGHYYRPQRDADLFKEVTFGRLVEIAEGLGKKAPFQAPFTAVPGSSIENLKKVGRNDPCPCGSGKKYKKCCLLKESDEGLAPSQEPPAPPGDPVYQGLRKKLDDYSNETITRKDFLNGAAFYWDTEPREPLVLPESAGEDQGDFHEWLLLDFRLSKGKTVIESFIEARGKNLTEEERAIAEGLSKSYQSVYEVQEVREGSGLTIKDLFTGQEMDVQEITSSYSTVPWDIAHLRVYATEGINRFASNGQVFPRRHISEMVQYVNDAYRTFRDQPGHISLPAFLKERPFLVHRFYDNLVESAPVFLTEERHRVISSRAHFVVSNYDRARDVLVRQYDFGDPEELKPKGVRLSWLKRGASKTWEMGTEEIENAMITTSNVVHPSGRLNWTVLGTVTLYPQKLTLECMSRERLERGKQRLEQLIGGFIRHRADEFEDIHAAMGRMSQKKAAGKTPVPDARARAMAATVVRQHMSAWPDEKLPALQGMTPREAVNTEEGRQKVLTLIKNFENMEARKKKQGEVSIDLSFLRKELGL